MWFLCLFCFVFVSGKVERRAQSGLCLPAWSTSPLCIRTERRMGDWFDDWCLKSRPLGLESQADFLNNELLPLSRSCHRDSA